MAEIRPFKALHFNHTLADNAGPLLSPPYDVIDPELQEDLYRRSPYNIIRLEAGRGSTAERYASAARTLQEWLDSGVLTVDPQPSLYLYEQVFTHANRRRTRRAVLAALKAEPYGPGGVLPHEKTMAGPKKDRLALLNHTETNTSPILTLLPDPEQRIAGLFAACAAVDPLIEAVDSGGEEHRLVPCRDPALQASFSAYLATRAVLIADGHHRFETALAFGRASSAGRPGRSYLLAALTADSDPGLLLLPTHRLLTVLTGPGDHKLENLLASGFSRLDRGPLSAIDLKRFQAELAEKARRFGAVGMLRCERAALLLPAGAVKPTDLPVTLLHERLLEPLHDAGDPGKPPGQALSFTSEAETALEAVRRGEAAAAFLLPPPEASRVYARARRGLVMPQKSTFFHPKLPGGLVLYHTVLSF